MKVDFLYDLKRISKDDYNLLILFMEIRNQLIHNIEIDTLEKVIVTIEKKQKFLNIDKELEKKYIKSKDEGEKEIILGFILDRMYISLLNILKSQIGIVIKEIDKEQEIESNKIIAEVYENFFDIMIETQKEISSTLSKLLSNSEKKRKDFERTLEVSFCREFNKRVEDKYGKLI